ncbi:MAG: MATE family efflux transporter [Spirochaetaceae bacterium]|jgi:putative MATE family efflux protein|nr:MATE family efflux transporter [Spirochaetaceae bacterium]
MTVVTQQNAANRLGTEPVGRLLLKFSVPAITGMLVNALYNLVDRIWVGHGVNDTALGGLSLVLPLMTVSMAFAMLFGIGSANLISMRLGQGRRADAEQALNHCFFLLTGAGLLLMILELIWLDPILLRMGAEEGSAALDYARSYYRIILYGQVFLMVGFGFSHCTRAQGFPAVTMLSMLIGAGLNMILDPVFIFCFDLGVEGAAWATIISQFVSMVWILSFSLGKRAVIRLNLFRGGFKPSARIILDIMAFGSSQFLLQSAMSAVQLLVNISLGWYGAGALGERGGDIALTGLNINMSIAMLILMPVFGINQGAQPILGFNYGAKHYERVRKAFLLAITGATAICLGGFIAAELFPRFLVGLFVSKEGNATLLNFASAAMRIIMIALPLNGFTIVATNFFVVTGRPKTSIFLSLLRQCIVFIPCLFIFGRIWGLWGVVATTPVADTAAFVCTGILILAELKKLKADHGRSLGDTHDRSPGADYGEEQTNNEQTGHNGGDMGYT